MVCMGPHIPMVCMDPHKDPMRCPHVLMVCTGSLGMSTCPYGVSHWMSTCPYGVHEIPCNVHTSLWCAQDPLRRPHVPMVCTGSHGMSTCPYNLMRCPHVLMVCTGSHGMSICPYNLMQCPHVLMVCTGSHGMSTCPYDPVRSMSTHPYVRGIPMPWDVHTSLWCARIPWDVHTSL
jgi:hypothetical protein